MNNENNKTPLTEEELEHAAGGGTANRYNPAECGKYTEVHYWCVGFLRQNWCDHYRRTKKGNDIINHKCVMGFFDYDSKIDF